MPEKYRRACAQRSPLLLVPPPAGVHLVFPFDAMWSAREVDGFFPSANWHPVGLSLKVVRDVYLEALGVAPPPHERLERGLVDAK